MIYGFIYQKTENRGKPAAKINKFIKVCLYLASYIFVLKFMHPLRILLTLIIALLCIRPSLALMPADSNTHRKAAVAYRIAAPPRIDGYDEDSAWSKIPFINDFRQTEPYFDTPATFGTGVKIAYDNHAIYVLAQMQDPHPDSILRQLGLRDQENLNADIFTIEFDTYNNQLDAYTFQVTASGVQLDSRESDETYDAVWDSKVVITRSGWNAELKIPYSALRFPKTYEQVWGMEISRNIRRYRESNQWAPEKPDATNDLPYWGVLSGIHSVDPPVRLSATPYLLLQAEHLADTASARDISTSIGGGMDIKYGINQGFTLDMSLLPDFSQVQSDNKVKNLSAFETVYDEQRPFFKEAVDLFRKGDLFYSRRIGKTPAFYYSLTDSLNEGEHIDRNPVQQRLINATKVSGRSSSGLAIGFLNALTANTWGTLSDQMGNKRKVLTDPMTNYNLLVVDQALKYNSEAYITNTCVIRSKDYRDANVTAAGISLNNRTNTYQLNLSGGLSQVASINPESGEREKTIGYKYAAALLKTKGNFRFSLGRSTLNDTYDANDMGLTLYNNYNNNLGSVSYNLYQPFWILLNMGNTLNLTIEENFTTHKIQMATLQYKGFVTTRKYLTLWTDAGYLFLETYDYYEPRSPGRYYIAPKTAWGKLGFSSDYRRIFALDGIIDMYYSGNEGPKGYSLVLAPIFRMSDHFQFTLSGSYKRDLDNFGYAGQSAGQIYFGKRAVNTYENSISGKYLFINNLSLSLNLRHYLSMGTYSQFYLLGNDGLLTPDDSYTGKHDFTFSSFNIDMVFSWIFAPGSSMNLVWKNSIESDKNTVSGSYFRNLDGTFSQAGLNNISFKILYYFDYQYFKK
jgi:hypothetical protein